LRSQFDSLDFSQDAWASFFHIPPERINFKTPQELLAFLSCLAHHKLIDQQRRQQRTLKRSRHEVNPPETNVKDLPGPHPTPSQVAIAEEQWSRLLQNKSPRVRSALELMRDGHSLREIAEHLGIHPKKLQRLLKCLRRKVLSS
jgi:RNA polymerase sigma factor (sigma-70 family)